MRAQQWILIALLVCSHFSDPFQLMLGNSATADSVPWKVGDSWKIETRILPEDEVIHSSYTIMNQTTWNDFPAFSVKREHSSLNAYFSYVSDLNYYKQDSFLFLGSIYQLFQIVFPGGSRPVAMTTTGTFNAIGDLGYPYPVGKFSYNYTTHEELTHVYNDTYEETFKEAAGIDWPQLVSNEINQTVEYRVEISEKTVSVQAGRFRCWKVERVPIRSFADSFGFNGAGAPWTTSSYYDNGRLVTDRNGTQSVEEGVDSQSNFQPMTYWISKVWHIPVKGVAYENTLSSELVALNAAAYDSGFSFLEKILLGRVLALGLIAIAFMVGALTGRMIRRRRAQGNPDETTLAE